MDVVTALQGLLTRDGRRDPYPYYSAVLGGGPVVTFGPDYAVVAGYREAGRVLRDPLFGVAGPAGLDRIWPQWRDHPSLAGLVTSMLGTNPPDHGRLRRLVSGAFTPRRIAAQQPVITARVDALIDELAEHGSAPVDFIARFASRLPTDTICALLGLADADRGWLRERARGLGATLVVAPLVTALEAPDQMRDRLAAADEAATQLTGYFEDVVQVRRRAPGDDLVSDLIAAHDDGGDRLSTEELISTLGLVLIAGTETTVNLLGNGLAALRQHPSEWTALRDRPDRAGPIVEEVLRFDSPVQATLRYAEAATELSGYPVNQFAPVAVLLGAANRDPATFADAAVFDPERYADAHQPAAPPLSFGAGPHFCIGAALARLQAQVAFPALAQRLPLLELAAEPRRQDQLVLRGYQQLPVTPGTPALAAAIPDRW